MACKENNILYTAIRVFISLTLLALCMYIFFISEYSNSAKEFLEANKNPWLFLAVIGVATVFGFPVSACYLIAGAVFGVMYGFLLCLAGIFLSSSFSYMLGRFCLPNGKLKSYLEKFSVGKFLGANLASVNFFVRAIPGVPYMFQGLILAALKTNYLVYMFVAISVQGGIAFCMCLFGSGLATAALEKIAVGIILILLLSVFHQILIRLKFCKN